MPFFSFSKAARTNLPRLPYETIKDDLLGRKYNLSLVTVGRARARALNQAHRGKDYVPNVLTFPLGQKHGEIYLTPTKAEAEAERYGLSRRAWVLRLYIHGLLHLKGYEHGDKMDGLEKRYCSKYKIS